jgi:hypothetical protein
MKIEYCNINKDFLIYKGDYVYFLRHVLFGWFSTPLQKFLYKHKIYWHDFLSGQCTPMFECCKHKIKNEKEAQLMKDIVRMSLEQQPIFYR